MKNKKIHIALLFFIILIIVPVKICADIGPKPSVVIDFVGLDNARYFATLLSERASTGPHSALEEHPGNQRYHEGDNDYDIWQKFVSYKDNDGYYFLQFFAYCSETSKFVWGYYPPRKFKILIYFPEEDEFVVSSEIYERYAFDSYYKVEMETIEADVSGMSKSIKAVKNYDYKWELLSLIARILATISIELLVALFFGYRSKKQLYFITTVNIATQTILNALLNIINYKYGSLMFLFNYVWMEVVVFMAEAIIYSALLIKYGEGDGRKARRWVPAVYALAANTLSFGVGIYLAKLIPGIF